MAKYRPKGPKGIGGMAGFDPMSLLQAVQQQMEEMEKALESQTFTGTAGGGAVEVVLNGHYRVQDIRITPELLEASDPDMLRDLLVAAFNNAVAAVREATNKQMSQIQEMFGPLAGLLGL